MESATLNRIAPRIPRRLIAATAAPYAAALLRLLLLFVAARPAAPQPGPEVAQQNTYGARNAVLNPSMAIIIVVLVCAFLVIGFFSLYLRYCSGGELSTPRSRSGGATKPKPRGLEASTIDALPIFLYSAVKGLRAGGNGGGEEGVLECAVCLMEFVDDEALRLLPLCEHVFHPDCIGEWLASHTTCPVCRANLAPPEASADGSAGDSAESDRSRSPRSGDAEPDAEEVAITIREEDGRRASQAVEAVDSNPGARRSFWKLTRSHSTGHSPSSTPPPSPSLPFPTTVPAADWGRYTLRLPEDVRKEILGGGGKLRRAASCGGRVLQGSGRRSQRKGFWDGLVREERTAAPSFSAGAGTGKER